MEKKNWSLEERKDREGKGTKYLRKEKYLEYRGKEIICDRNWDLDKHVEIVGIISIAGVPCNKKNYATTKRICSEYVVTYVCT